MSKPKTCGIYKISHIASGDSYIGASTDIDRRWVQHKSWARTGARNSKLYDAFKQYGIDAFSWQVIEQCDKDSLEVRERHWIAVMDTLRNGYNSTSGGEENKKFSEESIKKMSAAHKGKKQSKESIEKRIKRGADHHRFGNPVSEETRAKISASLTGKKQSEETKQKRSMAMTGRKMSAEAVEKSRLARTGIKFSEQARKNLSDARKGKKQSPETIQKRVESLKATVAARKLAKLQVTAQIQ